MNLVSLRPRVVRSAISPFSGRAAPAVALPRFPRRGNRSTRLRAGSGTSTDCKSRFSFSAVADDKIVAPLTRCWGMLSALPSTTRATDVPHVCNDCTEESSIRWRCANSARSKCSRCGEELLVSGVDQRHQLLLIVRLLRHRLSDDQGWSTRLAHADYNADLGRAHNFYMTAMLAHGIRRGISGASTAYSTVVPAVRAEL
jgi:hypothetical protein